MHAETFKTYQQAKNEVAELLVDKKAKSRQAKRLATHSGPPLVSSRSDAPEHDAPQA